MFRMRLNTRTTDIPTPNTLILDNVNILNTFQEMNSLINMTSYGGHVQLLNSKFEKLSICGGIVKNKWMSTGLADYT